MSATDAAIAELKPSPPSRRIELRDVLAFGTGVGVVAGARDLDVVVVRVRPSGAEVLGAETIERFRERPAAEWGAEYSAFLTRHGVAHIAAEVLLPRTEVIVRPLVLPGVEKNADIASAIGFQIDTLHPYGDEEVVHAWMRLKSPGAVLVAVIRKATLDRCLELFAEAGIAAASFSFSAAVLYAASRLLRHPAPEGCLAACRHEDGGLELYGESPAHPVFSAEFDCPPSRAAALAAAELRLAPGTEAVPVEELLPPPHKLPEGFDFSRNALAYATALAGACPRLAPAANLLPPERRSTSSRAMFVPTAALLAVLVVVSVVSLFYGAYRDHQYVKALEAEIGRLEPQARRAAELDSQIEKARARSRLLDQMRERSKSDLEALNEITRLLAPPVWASSVELTRDAVTIAGEAEAAAPLLSVLDNSPLFQNSQFSTPIVRSPNGEIFRIRTEREARR